MKYVFLLGRILFSLIFILKPIEYLLFGEMGVMFVNLGFLCALPILLGGLSILLGYYSRIGALLIVIVLLPITFCMHPFWVADTDFAQMMHSLCFWKNLSLAGAALMIIYTGSGPLSLRHEKKW